MLHDALLVLRKDLLIERRSKELLFTVIAFGLLATLVFALSFYIDKRSTVAFSPGVIWVVVLFSGTLGLQRLFAPENENDCMSGLLLSPADPRGIYLGKVMVQLVFSGAMELVTVPLIFLFFDLFPLVDPAKALVIVALLLLGTLRIPLICRILSPWLPQSSLEMPFRRNMHRTAIFELVAILAKQWELLHAINADALGLQPWHLHHRT